MLFQAVDGIHSRAEYLIVTQNSENISTQEQEGASARAWQSMRLDFQEISIWHEANLKSYEAASGSLLQLADQMSEPHQVSHVVGYLLLTAVDHLHALKMVMVDAKSQHMFAPYTLIRSAIENASTALWILQHNDPRSAALRALTLEYRGFADERRAAKAIDPTAVLEPERLKIFEDCLARHGFTKKEVQTPPKQLGLIEDVSIQFQLRNSAVTWQLCSAAAHGRQWAWKMLTRFEPQDDDGISKVVSGQLTSDETIIASALHATCNVVRKSLDTRRHYSTNPLHSGASFVKP